MKKIILLILLVIFFISEPCSANILFRFIGIAGGGSIAPITFTSVTESIDQDGSSVVTIDGGKGPFTWTVTDIDAGDHGDGVTWATGQTSTGSNTLNASDVSCGVVKITITDSDSNETSTTVKVGDSGTWTQIGRWESSGGAYYYEGEALADFMKQQLWTSPPLGKGISQQYISHASYNDASNTRHEEFRGFRHEETVQRFGCSGYYCTAAETYCWESKFSDGTARNWENRAHTLPGSLTTGKPSFVMSTVSAGLKAFSGFGSIYAVCFDRDETHPNGRGFAGRLTNNNVDDHYITTDLVTRAWSCP